LLLLALLPSARGQELPLELQLAVSHSNPFDTRNSDAYSGFAFPYFGLPDSVNGGFGVSGMFRYKLSDHLNVLFDLGYDYTYLYQDDVLDEWEWRYWEDTYIEFIPGLTVEDVNRTLRYNAESDTTQFSAIFIPTQRLRELKISVGGGFRLQIMERLSMNIDIKFGASLFSRELRMDEKWIKRFKLDPENPEKYDYEYKFDLLHFAPSKTGTRFYLAPSAGIQYDLGNTLALGFDFIYVQYLDRSQIGWLEDIFGISPDSHKWFPLISKYQLQIGLIFKY
jgi:hypothetical protein